MALYPVKSATKPKVGDLFKGFQDLRGDGEGRKENVLCWQASEFRGERRGYELPGEGRFGESGWGKSGRESCDPKWELLAGLGGRQSAE